MKPTEKSSAANSKLTSVYGNDREEFIPKGLCVKCEGPAETFKDVCSAKEYTISGLCQECQDKFWG